MHVTNIHGEEIFFKGTTTDERYKNEMLEVMRDIRRLLVSNGTNNNVSIAEGQLELAVPTTKKRSTK